MKLLDFLKKKKKGEKRPEKEKIKKKPTPLREKEKEETRSLPGSLPKADIKKKKEVSKIAYRVLSSPHITEKATMLGEENKYVFKVWQKTNKIEIKKAIEDLYGVNVDNVKIINIPRRKRRLGRQTGWKKGYKKAIVKIKQGQKIEVMPR